VSPSTLAARRTPAEATTGARRFALDVADRPEALLRVVGVCLRRGCDVRELRFTRAGTTRTATLEIVLRVGARHAGPLPAWLSAPVDVLAVRELPGDAT
jgi:acetolactate synthase regulatory subunit